MGLYEELMKRKTAGEIFDVNELTPEKLKVMFIDEEISDNMIASLFDVKPSKITYLRRKHGITIRNSIIDNFINDIPTEMETEIKKELLKDENITKIAKAVTHFSFRNGPIENMHADMHKNITDKDMKILNKYMVNRLAYIFILIKENRWFEFNYLVNQYDFMFGHNWDNAEPDDGGMGKLLKEKLHIYRN